MTFSPLLADELEAITEAGLYESREAFPGFLLACKRTLLVDSQGIAGLVLALQEKDRYSFRKDILDLLLS